MKRLWRSPVLASVGAALLVTIAMTAFAQSASTSQVAAALRSERTQYQAPLSKAQLAGILNAVAVKFDGWGLLSKPAGNNCPNPAGKPVACDILFNRATGHIYDVFADAEGASTPTFNDDGPADLNRWVAPVNGVVPPPPPPPVVPAADLTALVTQVTRLESRIVTLQAQVGTLQAAVQSVVDRPAPACAAVTFPNYSAKAWFGTVVLKPDR